MSYNSGLPRWFCFINGMEVSILAASTSSASNGLATAQITLPYSPFLMRLPKHTKITLFSYDPVRDAKLRLELDGVIQIITWRKDKGNGNTGLFLMCQTDGNVWSLRKKYNFYIDDILSLNKLTVTAQDYETQGESMASPLYDCLLRTIESAGGDGGRAANIFLTHTFKQVNNKFDGSLDYVDSGACVNTKDTAILGTDNEMPQQNYYSKCIQRYYQKYKTLLKVCRVPIPKKYLEAFEYQLDANLIMQTMSSAEGEVNFFNYATYLCDQYNFEIYDIPDASYATLTAEEIKYINPLANTTKINAVLAEYLIKPKSAFGPIPFCNVVFPDQILDKSFTKNFPAEVTRVATYSLQYLLDARTQGAATNFYKGPVYTKSDNDFFSSFNINKATEGYTERSNYEEYFGMNCKMVNLPSLIIKMAEREKPQTDSPDKIQNMLNYEWAVSYTDKMAFTMQVTPDTEIVPGFNVLALDENGEHIVAYCYGREKVWVRDGQYMVNLKLCYPRFVDNTVDSVVDILNPFDPTVFGDTYTQDIALMKKYIGSSFIDPSKTLLTYTQDTLMRTWIQNDRNTNVTKNTLGMWRQFTTYENYTEFYGEQKSYDLSKSYNVMPQKIVDRWELPAEAAKLACMQYVYCANGYSNSVSSKNATTAPVYTELNQPGTITPNPYITGIVNCHNRFLMQVGNSIM